MKDLSKMDLDELQAAYNAVEAQRETLRAEQERYGAEMNRRRADGAAARILAGIDPGALPALVKLATVQLAATPQAAAPEGE